MAIYGSRITAISGFGIARKPYNIVPAVWTLPLNFTLQFLGPSTDPFTVPQNYQSVQKNDVGIQFIVQVTDENGDPVPIISASSLVIKFQLPDFTTADYAAALLTDGSDGKLYYTTSSNELPQSGTYAIQAKVTINGVSKSSRKGYFNVEPNVDEN